ncbi:non-ribosomal peptide synthetase, partial [Rhodococcus opacus RKJ300 = JCM 13270]
GNSLIATQVVARLGAALDTQVPVRWLFSYPTVDELAERIDHALSAGDDFDRDAALRAVVPISRGNGNSLPLFCIHPMVGLAWCYGGLVQGLDDVPVYGLQTPSILEHDFTPESIEKVALRYASEIRQVQPLGPYRVLGWSLGGVLAHAVAAQLQSEGLTVESLVMLDAVLEIPDESAFHDEIRKSLRILGIDIRDDEKLSLTSERACELLEAVQGSAISLTVDRVQSLFTNAIEGPEMIRGYTPPTYEGDVLFFSAALDRETNGDLTKTWAQYVDGDIHEHPIDVTHGDMMTPESLESIGPLLRRHIG